MPLKSVAVEGDVTAVPGSNFTAGPVTYMSYPNFTVNGKKVIYGAMCTFTNNESGATTVLTLLATATVLQLGKQKVLRDGDQTPGPPQLKVMAANHLSSK